MFPYVNMKHLTIICLLLGIVFARDGQINLEDIERDNLNSERIAHAQRQPNNQPPQTQLFVTQRPEFSVGPHLFSPEAREYAIFQQFPQQQLRQPIQYLQQSPGPAAIPGQSTISGLSAIPGQHQATFPRLTPQLQSSGGSSNQGVYFEQGFVPSSRYAVLQSLQGQNNIQRQYPYLDPNSELLRSPNLQQRLADSKQSHNFAGLIQRYAHTNFLQPNYQPPVPQAYALQNLESQPVVTQPVYVPPRPTATNLNPTYQQTNQVLGQQRFLVPGITYARNQQIPIYATQQAQQSNTNLVYEKNGPLVGVYVPSAVQIQYLKQLQQLQQQQTNSIVQPGKLQIDVSEKGGSIKSLDSPFISNSNLQYPFPFYDNVK